MKIRTSIIIGLTVVVITAASIFLFSQSNGQSTQVFSQTEIPVVSKPLTSGGETVQVQIQCDPVYITRPEVIERFNCVLANLTAKSIRASSVRYSVISENAGREQRSDRLDITDTYIHPDLAEMRKPIPPGGKLHVMAPGPLTEPGSVIKKLELEPVYIEFSDGTTVGTSGESAAKIAEVRDGASTYKKALRKEFLSNGKSAQSLVPLLENAEFVESEAFINGARTGANIYRKFLLEKYRRYGALALGQLLEN